jgi:hypothetical protein
MVPTPSDRSRTGTRPARPTVDALLPIRVAAELSGIGVDVILDLVAAGVVRVVRIRGKLFVALTDLDTRPNARPPADLAAQ